MRKAEATSLPLGSRTRGSLVNPARRQQRLLSVALFSLLIMALIGPYVTYKPAPFTGEGSPLRQALYIVIYGVVLFAARVTDRPRRALTLPLSMTILLGYCVVTLTWAIDPDIAVRRLVLTTIITLTMFTILEYLGYAGALAMTRAMMIVALVTNVFFVVAIPSIGIHQVGELVDPELVGNWRGILMQKNFTGALCALTVIMFLFDSRRLSPILRVGMLIATLFFLYMTKSKTSMGLLAIAVAAGLLYRLNNPRYRALVLPALAIVTGLAVVLVALYWTEITAPLSDPRALTGRAQIWPVVLSYWRDHWLEGAGYGSFWNIGNASPIYQYTADKNWVRNITSGHNGYIDLLVQIGLPGTLLAIACLIMLPLGKLLASTSIDRRAGSLIVAVLVFCWLHNLTESSLLDRDQIVQVFLMLGVAMAEVTTRAHVAEPARGRVASPALSVQVPA